MGQAMAVAALAITALMLTTWVISIMVKNASIVDIVWGFGFVVVAWTVRLTVDGDPVRQNLIVFLVTAWGLRLALHLARRNIGHGEDFRYVLMRRKHGSNFPMVSLVTVFGLQGVLMWTVSLPVQLGQADDGMTVGPIALMATIIWAVGFLFESVGDVQLTKFKKDPANAGQVMDEAGTAVIGLVGPVVMTILLTRVSGVPMLEHSMAKRRPGYADYVKRTSAFFPRPPRAV